MKIWFSLFFILASMSLSGQINLTITGKTYSNSEDTWEGVNIQRTSKTNLVFSNNQITSLNRYGYMLQAGDESPKTTGNNLDGARITGNKLVWKGTDMSVIPHGIFTGHNSNVVVRFNYLDNVPMGIIRKSGNNMTNTGGGVAYNIVRNGAVQMVIKGMSNVNVFNNTFYTERTTSQTWRPLLHIYTNTDNGKYSVSHGTKIYNNIFYTRYQTLSITIADAESLKGLECDYNIYWCENGEPRFSVNGKVISFSQWQAMGYDTHSLVMNPQFTDKVNFVPSKPLDFGKDLGAEWNKGLSVRAAWGTADPATSIQGSKWQIGAVIHEITATPSPSVPQEPSIPPAPVTPEIPVYTQSVVEDAAPSRIVISFNTKLQDIVPVDSSFTARINGNETPVSGVTVSGEKVVVSIDGTITKGDIITVSYSRPATKPLQSVSGGQVDSFAEKNVLNNVLSVKTDVSPGTVNEPEKISIYPNPAKDFLNVEVQNVNPDLVRQIVVFDIGGKQCFERKMTFQEMNKVEINLKPGLYIVQIRSGDEIIFLKKIVVIHS